MKLQPWHFAREENSDMTNRTNMALIKAVKMASMALAIFLMAGEVRTASAELPDDTTVYWNGSGKRVHIAECPRTPKDPAEEAKRKKVTLAEAKQKGRLACARCPGSRLD